eukprot:CAMPEP_0117438044 /NCGR_PEP_ID=MMETSP0759-20121206/1846_1 /TAXON_ID=63605 /ORGANISM="Percolomonas cosmopolitus, Strain WS" /LENGTH=386 /DNA_ID=CAMNT_0005229715 /DNA_START=795 /DNA_END=1955 /DNA_ORIENTATION=-
MNEPKFDMNNYAFVKDFFYSIKGREHIHAISLANNGITSMDPYQKIGNIFPNIKQLIFDNNNISHVIEFNKLSSASHLESLSFVSNPCANQNPIQLTALTNLKTVNGQPFKTQMASSQDIANMKLPAVNTASVDPSVSTIVQSFVLKYVGIFQQAPSNRQELMYAYDQNAIFSHTVNPSHDMETDRSSKDDLHELRKMKSHDVSFNRTFEPRSGSQDIVKFLCKSFPPMMFNTNFSVDAHLLQIPTGEPVKVIVSIYGQLQLNNIIRNYNRTFVLLPADQQGKERGWEVKIVNDMFNILARVNDTDLDFKPSATTATGFGGTTGSGFGTFGQQNDQTTKIQQLCQQTNMTEHYSKVCLESSNWDLNQALQLFNQHRQTLPPNAFKH